MDKNTLEDGLMLKRKDVEVCKYKCLYVKDVYHTICNDCEKIIENFLGERFKLFILNRMNKESGNAEYTNGVRAGLMEAIGIIQGIKKEYWF